jgi:hypothetical protein
VLADPEGGNYAEPLVRKLAGLPYPADPALREPGVKVLHVPDFDIHSVCNTLVSCLEIIKAWLDAHPDSVPVPIMMELKTADAKGEAAGGARVIRWDDADLLNGLDAEIRSVFSPRQLITPDDLRRNGSSLEASVLEHGWPNLDSARGRIMFLMDNGPEHEARYKYIEGRPNLEGRVLFTNSAPGQSDCAFQKVRTISLAEQGARPDCVAQRSYDRGTAHLHHRASQGQLLGSHACRCAHGDGPQQLLDVDARRRLCLGRSHCVDRLSGLRHELALGLRLRRQAAQRQECRVQPRQRARGLRRRCS